jgi:sec-independent protein translocase protein TatB
MIFGIGPGELFVILVIALLVFGPDRLPKVISQVAGMIRQFRRVTADLTAEFREVTKEFSAEFDELRSITQDLQAELAGVRADLTQELASVQEALNLETGEAATAEQASSYASVTNSIYDSPATEAGMTASAPPEASKHDPRADVSLFDLDEVVVMPRSERRTNGHVGLNGHAAEPVPPARVPSVLARPNRRTKLTYQRPRARARAS